MSHSKERTEKNCLNCNAQVLGRFCSVCGQENLEPQESISDLIAHFFNDITHFDGKFFKTLKYLILKPGFLSAEYMSGRRVQFLNPVRMYIFTSFIFFFIFFTFFSRDNKEIKLNSKLTEKKSILNNAKEKSFIDSAKAKKEWENNFDYSMDASIPLKDYRDRKEYDSLLETGSVKDNFLKRLYVRKEIDNSQKYGNDTKRINTQIGENFKHSFPQIFFISLPLLALVLKLMYIRRRKFYYVSHAIFSVHLFIFVYIAALAIYTLAALSGFKYFGWVRFINILLTVSIFYYAYKAMLNFYHQSIAKTFLKYLLLLVALLFILIIAMLIMLFYSFYKL